jgi:hypothetical protein
MTTAGPLPVSQTQIGFPATVTERSFKSVAIMR